MKRPERAKPKMRPSPDPLTMLQEYLSDPALHSDAVQTAYRYHRNRDDAEDIVCEAIRKAYRSIETYDSRMKFGAWFIRIVRNTAIDELRRRSTQRAEKAVGFADAGIGLGETDGEGSIQAMIESVADPVDHYAGVIDEVGVTCTDGVSIPSERLTRALAMLPHLQRSVLLMTADGKRIEVVAFDLEVSVSSAKALLSSARKRLKEVL